MKKETTSRRRIKKALLAGIGCLWVENALVQEKENYKVQVIYEIRYFREFESMERFRQKLENYT